MLCEESLPSERHCATSVSLEGSTLYYAHAVHTLVLALYIALHQSALATLQQKNTTKIIPSTQRTTIQL
jgi:hypothetical protein